MSEKSPDRRTLKTKKAICQALAELLTEKELHKVTVQEIADKADVNRVTFYKHYLDVYDLYDKIEQETLIEMGILVLRLEELPTKEFFKNLTDYIKENKAIFTMIFSPNSTGNLRDKFAKCMEGLFLKLESEKRHTGLDDKKLQFHSGYRTQGCLAVISKWVLSGFPDDQDYIVKLLSEFDTKFAT